MRARDALSVALLVVSGAPAAAKVTPKYQVTIATLEPLKYGWIRASGCGFEDLPCTKCRWPVQNVLFLAPRYINFHTHSNYPSGEYTSTCNEGDTLQIVYTRGWTCPSDQNKDQPFPRRTFERSFAMGSQSYRLVEGKRDCTGAYGHPVADPGASLAVSWTCAEDCCNEDVELGLCNQCATQEDGGDCTECVGNRKTPHCTECVDTHFMGETSNGKATCFNKKAAGKCRRPTAPRRRAQVARPSSFAPGR